MPAISPTAKRTTRCRTVPKDWWKRSSAFVAAIPDKKLTLNPRSSGEDLCKMDKPRSLRSRLFSKKWHLNSTIQIFSHKSLDKSQHFLTLNSMTAVAQNLKSLRRNQLFSPSTIFWNWHWPNILTSSELFYVGTVFCTCFSRISRPSSNGCKNSFLNGELSKNIYMEQLEWFENKPQKAFKVLI